MKDYIRAFDPKKRKEVVCGYVDGDTYHRSVNNRHYFVKYGGYGVQTLILDRLIRKKVKYIVITTHKGTKLKSDIIDWVRWGRKRNYGHGKQTFLGTKFMKEQGDK